MAFFPFTSDSIIYTTFETRPSYNVVNRNDVFTGSVTLEKPFLTASLEGRLFWGYSEAYGGLTSKVSPFTASITLLTTTSGTANEEEWWSIKKYYDYYNDLNADYQTSATTFRVINIPEIYFDSSILTGSFTASDYDAAGAQRIVYDNGRGGLYSGSLTGTLVGHIFYSEGLAVLTASQLSNFGSVSSVAEKWRVQFKGVHKIPTTIYNCNAPGGQLNATTNASFYTVPTSGPNANLKIQLSQGLAPYITTIGLYNEDYELVGLARVAQPVKKDFDKNILFRLKMDF